MKKVNYANLVHMFARILNFYACNARLPNYVNIATTTLKTYRKGVWVWGGDPLKNNPIPTTNHTDDSEVLFLG